MLAPTIEEENNRVACNTERKAQEEGKEEGIGTEPLEEGSTGPIKWPVMMTTIMP